MEHREPSRSAAEEALRSLEERLDRASDAAERMMAEAAAAAASQPPPAGWQAPASESDGAAGNDLDLLMQLVGALRDLIPPELQQRLAEAMRELLLAIRAMIDWYLEHNERRRGASSEVQDIPIA